MRELLSLAGTEVSEKAHGERRYQSPFRVLLVILSAGDGIMRDTQARFEEDSMVAESEMSGFASLRMFFFFVLPPRKAYGDKRLKHNKN